MRFGNARTSVLPAWCWAVVLLVVVMMPTGSQAVGDKGDKLSTSWDAFQDYINQHNLQWKTRTLAFTFLTLPRTSWLYLSFLEDEDYRLLPSSLRSSLDRRLDSPQMAVLAWLFPYAAVAYFLVSDAFAAHKWLVGCVLVNCVASGLHEIDLLFWQRDIERWMQGTIRNMITSALLLAYNWTMRMIIVHFDVHSHEWWYQTAVLLQNVLLYVTLFMQFVWCLSYLRSILLRVTHFIAGNRNHRKTD
ncbi:hypothetical protein QOT17_013848 [Balamuthia mandrillaris]